MTESYDEVPYPSYAYTQSHPNHLAALAKLLSLQPASVASCRVLEVGCASGGNLLPMAYSLRGSRFVGLDLSTRQIEEARQKQAALGLENIEFLAQDLLEVDDALGEFDFIIAHGVFSWVPQAVQNKLLAVCRRHLAPQGIAYISYNSLPGWHMMGMLRQAMLYHTRDLIEPYARAKEARRFIQFLSNSLDPDSHPIGRFVQSYAQGLEGRLDGDDKRIESLLLHDELADVNQALYFHEFIEQAQGHGLQYLIEADFSSAIPSRLAPDVVGELQQIATDLISMEFYLDLLRNRTLRQTLLCHAELTPVRTLNPERLRGMVLTSRAAPLDPDTRSSSKAMERFRAPDGAIFTTDHPVSQAALRLLAERRPLAISFEDLLAEGRGRKESPADVEHDEQALGASLLQAFSYSNQLIDVHTQAPKMVARPGSRPRASAYARIQVQGSPIVSNLWHERVQLEPIQRFLLGLLNGEHDRKALLDHLAAAAADGRLHFERDGQPVTDSNQAREIMQEELERHLNWFGRAALLEA